MKAKISESLLALLESASETKALLPALLVREPTLAIEGTGDLIDAFSSACEDLLNRVGFDEDYNPNVHLRSLEQLIDDLFE